MSDSPLFNAMLQAELWGHHDPEAARQVRQVWDATTAHNDHVFAMYERAFAKLDRDRMPVSPPPQRTQVQRPSNIIVLPEIPEEPATAPPSDKA